MTCELISDRKIDTKILTVIDHIDGVYATNEMLDKPQYRGYKMERDFIKTILRDSLDEGWRITHVTPVTDGREYVLIKEILQSEGGDMIPYGEEAT